MLLHRCPRCNKDFSKLSHLTDHLQRKNKICDDIQNCLKTNAEILDIIDQDSNFYRIGRTRSIDDIIKVFEFNNNTDQLKYGINEIISQLHSEIEIKNKQIEKFMLLQSPTNPIVLNTRINNFGSEEIHYILSDSKYLDSCLISIKINLNTLVEKIYFDKTKPENNTVKFISDRQKTVLIHKDNEWLPKYTNETIAIMLHKAANILHEYHATKPIPTDDLLLSNMKTKNEYLRDIFIKKKPEIFEAISAIKIIMRNFKKTSK
jgi:hypothetical protein